jgi:zinc transporter 1
LVVAVGCAGLLSNIVGLFLFHGAFHDLRVDFVFRYFTNAIPLDHGHSHGGHSHSHSHRPADLEAAKPQTVKVSKRNSLPHSHSGHSHGPTDRTPLLATTAPFVPGGASTSDSAVDVTDADQEELERAEEELFVHPVEFRAGVIRAAEDAGYGTARVRSMSESSLKKAPHSHDHGGHSHTAGEPHTHSHEGHDHGAEDEHSHGHGGKSEGSMNMEGVFLHVLGDAVSFPSHTSTYASHK